MKIYVDAQLPPSIARALDSAGHQARHVEELGLRHATDTLLWMRATADRAVIFTKDADFVHRRARVATGPAVVWLRIGNCSTADLRRWLMRQLPGIERMIEAGEVLVEVR